MIYTALFSALLFYIFPTLVGRTIYRVGEKLIQRKQTGPNESKNLSLPFISYFILGSFTIYAALLVSYFAFPNADFKQVMQFTLGIIAFIALPANLIFQIYDLSLKKYILPITISIVSGIIAYLVWQINSPYSFNWDLYEHQTLVNNIFQGRFGPITSQITDTFGFNGYTTFFHSLIAGSQSLFNLNPLEYWSVISLIHFIIVIFSSFLLAKVVTNSKPVATFAAVTTALIFDSNMSFSTLFLIPQTFTAVVFILLFSQLLTSIKKSSITPFWLVMVGIVFLLLNHFIVGLVAVGIYLFTYLYFRFPKILKDKDKKPYMFGSILALELVAIFASSFISLDSLNKGEAESFNLNLVDKFNTMKQVYGYLLALLPLGIYATLKKRDEMQNIFLFIAAGLLIIVLLNLPYVLKFFVIERYFIQIILSIGFFEIFRRITFAPLRYLGYFATILVFFLIFVINSSIWKGGLLYHNTLSHMSSYEENAGRFLKERYSENTLIISDPATQHALEPISLLNTQGSAYMSEDTRKKLIAVNNADSTEEVTEILRTIEDNLAQKPQKRLFVLSGRYFEWQKSPEKNKLSLAYNIWAPSDLSYENIHRVYDFIGDKDNFKVIFANPSMYIFEVNN